MYKLFDDFSLGPLGDLRDAEFSSEIENGIHLVSQVYLSWDEDNVQIDVTVDSAPGELMAITTRVDGTPRWVTLNFGVGEGQMEVGDVICIVVQGKAAGNVSLPVYLRSAMSWGLEDTWWANGLTLTHEDAIVVACHTLEPDDRIGEAPGFHTLVISLPKSSFGITITDMRLIHFPARQTLRSTATTIASEA